MELITKDGVEMFYLGNQDQLDALVLRILQSLERTYPKIRYAVVLSRIPEKNRALDTIPTMVPEGPESVPARFAIDRRNHRMVLCKVSHKSICGKQIAM